MIPPHMPTWGEWALLVLALAAVPVGINHALSIILAVRSPFRSLARDIEREMRERRHG